MNAQRPKRRMNTHSALLNKYYQPKAGMNAQQRQKRDRIFQDAALLNKYLDGAALTDEEKKRVPRLQKNAQQRKRRRKDSALLKKYYEDDLPVTDEEEKRVLRLDTARIKMNLKRHASAPLLNEPSADEEEAVPFVAPVKVRALCSHEGCKNQFRAGGLDASAKPERRVFVSRMVHRQDVVTTRGAPSRLSEEGSATVMVRVRGLKWFGVNAASVLRLATPCKRWVEIWCVFVTPA